MNDVEYVKWKLQQRYVKSSAEAQKRQSRPCWRCVCKTAKMLPTGEGEQTISTRSSVHRAGRHKRTEGFGHRNQGHPLRNTNYIPSVYSISFNCLTANEKVFYYPHFRIKETANSQGWSNWCKVLSDSCVAGLRFSSVCCQPRHLEQDREKTNHWGPKRESPRAHRWSCVPH